MKRLKNTLVCWFIIGFLSGLFGSAIYLLIAGPPVLFYPKWVDIVGYPGIEAGWWAYDSLGWPEYPAEAFGSLTLGIFYGLVGVLIGLSDRKLRNPQKKA